MNNLSNTLGAIVTVLGLITAIAGPVAATLAANPLIASHATLAKILAAVGVAVTVAGVAHDALKNWIAVNADTKLKLAVLNRP